MSKKAVIRIFLGVAIFFILAIIFQNLYRWGCRLEKNAHHEQIAEFTFNDVTYQPEKLDEEIQAITNWIESSNVYEADLGHLYERLSNCYKAKNDYVMAYEAIGKSLYYLQEGKDYNYTINIYLDLAANYIMNLSFNHAENCMNHVYEIQPLEDITDLQIRSYAYRTQGILQREKGEYEAALKSFERANEIVNESNTNTYEGAYRAIIDVNIAKTYVAMGRLDEAEQIILEYRDSELLEPTMFVDMIARGFIIPYYETSMYLYAYKADEAMIKASVDSFVEECEKFEYYAVELDALLSLASMRAPESSPEFTQGYYDILNRVYRLATEKQNEEYFSIIAGSIDSSLNTERIFDLNDKARWSRVQTYVMYVVFVLLLFVVIFLIVNTSRRDGLTGVYNRRELNRVLSRLKSKNQYYAVCMIDIDHFKHVNDTFGHQNGDKVLSGLGKMLLNTISHSGKVYRFGGEEFTIIISKALEDRKIIAEKIRQEFEKMQWDFTDESITISVGVALGRGSEDVLEAADNNLYESKRNGRNCVTAE